MNELTSSPTGPKWRPLERNERRVAGVLVEKAKTTPDNYPLSINALVNGCNQKNNRFPQMTLDEDQVSEALDSLRKLGAVALIQGDGRVEKYRHLLYDWLGVDKFEMAVMAELLLRGAQTMGELRGRAARMEPIKDIGELGPIVERLQRKNLIVFLTPPGRGGVVTHNLYQPQELAKLRTEHGSDGAEIAAPVAAPPPSRVHVEQLPRVAVAAFNQTSDGRPTPSPDGAEMGWLREELAALRRELSELRDHSDAQIADLRCELDDLKSQLGA